VTNVGRAQAFLVLLKHTLGALEKIGNLARVIPGHAFFC
jgi:hypothetical protein